AFEGVWKTAMPSQSAIALGSEIRGGRCSEFGAEDKGADCMFAPPQGRIDCPTNANTEGREPQRTLFVTRMTNAQPVKNVPR
ncbi:MAG: hypothetical protein ACRD5K_19945, partial [Candidatus Acidiferrales bacterium]